MMIGTRLNALFSKSYVLYTLWNVDTLKASGAVVGWLWLCIEVANFFSTKAGDWCKSRTGSILLLVAALLIILWLRRPIMCIRCRLNNRDVHIAIRVGNLLRIRGACVITTNTTFDMDLDFIDEDSLQGQFTRDYYDSKDEHLDSEIKEALADPITHPEEPEHLSGQRKGNRQRYPVGTTVSLIAKKRRFYLVALAHLNGYGNVEPAVTLDTIREAVAGLWSYVSRYGEYGPIAMGLAGTGRGRTNTPGEAVAKEIIKSFVAACAESKFCNEFTLVINPSYLQTYRINLYKLGDYLRYICEYTEWEGSTGTGSGTAILSSPKDATTGGL